MTQQDQVYFKSVYAALAARMEKEKPTSWAILPERSGYKLVKIGE